MVIGEERASVRDHRDCPRTTGESELWTDEVQSYLQSILWKMNYSILFLSLVSKDSSGISFLFEPLINFHSCYNIGNQRLSDIALVWLSMSNTEGGTKPGAVFLVNKAINSKHNRTTWFKRLKMQAFQGQVSIWLQQRLLILFNKTCCSPLRHKTM